MSSSSDDSSSSSSSSDDDSSRSSDDGSSSREINMPSVPVHVSSAASPLPLESKEKEDEVAESEEGEEEEEEEEEEEAGPRRKVHVTSAASFPTALPLESLGQDWYGSPVTPPMQYSFGLDSTQLHFFVSRSSPPAQVHPNAKPGDFTAGLWEYDVAELFLLNSQTGKYLEFNLAPNGAWWASVFKGRRDPVDEKGTQMEGVITFGTSEEEQKAFGRWDASASIPLPALADLGFDFISDDDSLLRLEATFILGEENKDSRLGEILQRFLCASRPSNGEPDFHRPQAWKKIEKVPL